MKKLGLIGGTGPESTLVYYGELNRRLLESTGHYAEMTVESVALDKALELCGKNDLPELERYLGQAVASLEHSGAQVIALTANTMHIVFDGLQRRTAVPMISILDAAVQAAKEKGYHRLGLMGTRFTMEQDFFRKPFEQAGFAVVTPDAKQKELLMQRLMEELERGIVKQKTVDELIAIVQSLKEREAIDALILGCTELPLALNAENCPVPVLDTMQLHIDAILKSVL